MYCLAILLYIITHREFRGCTRARSGHSFLTTGQIKRWTTDSVKKISWGQGHKSFLVRYARVWHWAPTVQLVSCHIQCVFAILWPNATALLPNKFYMLTCDWAPGLMTAGLPIFFQPWLVWYKNTCSKKSCGTVNPLISVVLLWTSAERETLGVLDTLFWWPTRAQQQNSQLYRWCALPPKKALATRSPYSLS